MSRLIVNADGLHRKRENADIPTLTELAARIGVNQSNMSRVLAGALPSNRFIAGIAALFGYESFPTVFTLLEDNE